MCLPTLPDILSTFAHKKNSLTPVIVVDWRDKRLYQPHQVGYTFHLLQCIPLVPGPGLYNPYSKNPLLPCQSPGQGSLASADTPIMLKKKKELKQQQQLIPRCCVFFFTLISPISCFPRLPPTISLPIVSNATVGKS